MKVPVDKIVIKDRARVEIGDDFEALKQSIKQRGLINPICVTKEDFELVAGFRRLKACKELGWKKIEVKLFENLSSLEKKVLELEENIHKELTWIERAKLRKEIHELYKELKGAAVKGHESDGWGLKDSAEVLGISTATLSQDISLLEASETLPEISKYKSRKQALKAYTKLQETAILSELAKRQAEGEKSAGKLYHLYCGDAVKVIKENLDDEVVDLVIFDPPWGVDIDIIASARGPSGTKASYRDDSETYAVELAFNLIPELYRVMKPDTHMYLFCGIQYVSFYKALLEDFAKVVKDVERVAQYHKHLQEPVGRLLDTCKQMNSKRRWKFIVDELPLIWVKEGGGYTDFDTKFMPRYEMILFCRKGYGRGLSEATSNVFEFNRPSTVERLHTQEKPIDLLQKFIKISTAPNELVLDPCAGSFATVVAATLSGRRSIGIEKDKELYTRGLDRVKGFLAKEKEDES